MGMERDAGEFVLAGLLLLGTLYMLVRVALAYMFPKKWD